MFIFYIKYIGIKLTHYSLIILITKIFNGINDPIVSALIDRFTPKDGQENLNLRSYGEASSYRFPPQ